MLARFCSFLWNCTGEYCILRTVDYAFPLLTPLDNNHPFTPLVTYIMKNEKSNTVTKNIY
jgi:hypothetical protein